MLLLYILSVLALCAQVWGEHAEGKVVITNQQMDAPRGKFEVYRFLHSNDQCTNWKPIQKQIYFEFNHYELFSFQESRFHMLLLAQQDLRNVHNNSMIAVISMYDSEEEGNMTITNKVKITQFPWTSRTKIVDCFNKIFSDSRDCQKSPQCDVYLRTIPDKLYDLNKIPNSLLPTIKSQTTIEKLLVDSKSSSNPTNSTKSRKKRNLNYEPNLNKHSKTPTKLDSLTKDSSKKASNDLIYNIDPR